MPTPDGIFPPPRRGACCRVAESRRRHTAVVDRLVALCVAHRRSGLQPFQTSSEQLTDAPASSQTPLAISLLEVSRSITFPIRHHGFR